MSDVKLLYRIDDRCTARWWLGLVYRDFSTMRAVCAPMPLSIVMRIGWLLWQWARCPFRDSLIEQRYRALREEMAYLDDQRIKHDASFAEWQQLSRSRLDEQGRYYEARV